MEKKNLILLFVIFALIGLLILFMPQIYNFTQSLESNSEPKPEVIEESKNEEVEKITMDSEIVSELTYPVMRNDLYSSDSYYQLSSMLVTDMTNNDILYNAFIDLYEGYLKDHSTVGCASNSKEFSASYLESRIKNVIGRNVDYTNETFIVPSSNSSTEYVGEWRYNEASDSYIYYGDCNTVVRNTMYYDLTKLVNLETENENSILYLYYYVAFAKIEKNQVDYTYTIYSDANMEKEIKSGNINSIEEINSVYEEYLKENPVRMYKYTFKKGLCTYDNYCFYKGEWVND